MGGGRAQALDDEPPRGAHGGLDMNEEWWERPTCFICDYGWIILLIIILALALFFTRNLWMPLLGL